MSCKFLEFSAEEASTVQFITHVTQHLMKLSKNFFINLLSKVSELHSKVTSGLARLSKNISLMVAAGLQPENMM